MKKIKNKKTIPMSAKIARLGLVGILLMGIVLILCSFTIPYTINLNISQQPNYLYKVNDVEIPKSDFDDYSYTFFRDSVLGEKVFKIENDILYIDQGDSFEEFGLLSENTIPDGFYSVFSFVNVQGNADPFALLIIDGADVLASFENSGYLFTFYTIDQFNDNIINFSMVSMPELSFISQTSYILVPYEEPTVVDNISNVWSNILLWITSAFNSVVGIFWTGTQFTLIGTLALVGTAIALCLLIYHKVKDYLKMQ